MIPVWRGRWEKFDPNNNSGTQFARGPAIFSNRISGITGHGGEILKGFQDAGLDAVHLISTHFPLTRTQSHGHTELQGRLRNTVQLCTWKERKWV